MLGQVCRVVISPPVLPKRGRGLFPITQRWLPVASSWDCSKQDSFPAVLSEWFSFAPFSAHCSSPVPRAVLTVGFYHEDRRLTPLKTVS
jgi:hypothetical protein